MPRHPAPHQPRRRKQSRSQMHSRYHLCLVLNQKAVPKINWTQAIFENGAYNIRRKKRIWLSYQLSKLPNQNSRHPNATIFKPISTIKAPTWRCSATSKGPKGRGRKLVGQREMCIERIYGATFWMWFLERNKLPFDVADTLTAVYHDILARMHHNHPTTLPLTS